MAIKLPNLNFYKFGKKILLAVKTHIITIWIIFGLLLLIFASYIYYYQIYIASSAVLSPTIQLPVAEKNQLNQILKDLDDREKKQQSSKIQKIPNPFEPIQ